MTNLLKQMKKRRIDLGLKQHDMMLRVGMSRQQYQRLESKGNPRLDTLELIAKGLKSELLLIPQEKLDAVITVLAEENPDLTSTRKSADGKKLLSDDPWQGLLGDEE
ncbi:helix-turn-helix transcriptional regulator [Pseudoteredinibacter isoporae]|uniref:Transcriptional regulator with XRE-family HTH domain n=1 Tax=Pseudoteredinibacter isoporae TaxID=570281 RepID=A0A7X0JPQ4_9GAMM|nr:helix-turn-helix transcriptional regulator [Pseudoteredinibacter isoporae]MBB6519995.1 transcriptional regulator with XRE-family HTH domain [Pseudoteredinibacter isoporae]NHO85567.1 helix-turn-helix transcriptional regulator [Pseudoteredinibacter isoporae]NIB25981.1 helix-turn-helix transcriptional regulator [Pseudoteredinibacter isoporae]